MMRQFYSVQFISSYQFKSYIDWLVKIPSPLSLKSPFVLDKPEVLANTQNNLDYYPGRLTQHSFKIRGT